VFRLVVELEDARPAREGPRYRVKLRDMSSGAPLLTHWHLRETVEQAIEDAEKIFGPLEWTRTEHGAGADYDWFSRPYLAKCVSLD
jgi:hypothetical protein